MELAIQTLMEGEADPIPGRLQDFRKDIRIVVILHCIW